MSICLIDNYFDISTYYSLMCFAEEHVGHIISEPKIVTEDQLKNSSFSGDSKISSSSDHRVSPASSDDDDNAENDDDEEYQEVGRKRKVTSQQKKKLTSPENVATYSDRSKNRSGSSYIDPSIKPSEGDDCEVEVENGTGKKRSFQIDKPKGVTNRSREVECLSLAPAPSRSKKALMEIWMHHYYALLSYGEEHKDSKGIANHDVPKGYIYGKGEDATALGDWVSKQRLNLKTMAQEKYELLLVMFDGSEPEVENSSKKSSDGPGDDSKAESDDARGNVGNKCRSSAGNGSSDRLDDDCAADSEGDPQGSKQQQHQQKQQLQQEQQQQLQQNSYQHQQQQQHSQLADSDHHQQMNCDQQSRVQAPSSSSSSRKSKEYVDASKGIVLNPNPNYDHQPRVQAPSSSSPYSSRQSSDFIDATKEREMTNSSSRSLCIMSNFIIAQIFDMNILNSCLLD